VEAVASRTRHPLKGEKLIANRRARPRVGVDHPVERDDSTSLGLRRAGAKPVLVRTAAPRALPFDVLESKLRVPTVSPETVSRTALVNRLRAAGAFPLVIVVTPAGYGKTTLLSQWANRDSRSFAWVTIDERDNDPAVLLRHLSAALDRIEPIAPSALAALRPNGKSVTAKALPLLAEAVASRESPFVLVLDGADLLTRDSASAVASLIEQVPAGSMVALSGRVLPRLPVAKLRAGGPLLEIGPYELALSRREAEILLRAARVELSDPEINELLERTEGWAAGLHLAALAFEASGSNNGDPGEALAITGDDRYFADYFRSEYLSHLSPDRLAFLRRTSVLETMSGPLCDAVLERKESALELASIEKSNLFLVPLDRHRGWFRYHRLLRDLLRRELEEREPDLVPVLNQRAADWFESQGDAESTLEYSHGAGNTDSAARILSSIAMAVCCSGRVATVESWLERFDDDALLELYPAVAVEGSRVHALRGRPDEAEHWLAAAERGVGRGEDDLSIRACISVLRAIMCAHGPKRMLSDAESGLADLAPEHSWHPWALLVNGCAHVLLGDDGPAGAILTEAANASERLGRTESHALALCERSLLAPANDDEKAESLALQARYLIEDAELDAYATSALEIAISARTLLRHGQWDDARRQLTVAQRLAPSLTHAIPWLSLQVRLELIRAYVTLRDRDGAQARLAEAEDILSVRPAAGVLGEQVAKLQVETDAMPQTATGSKSGLTGAELRLLPLLSTHLSFREIGERLFVSRNTIKTQAISVYRKLGVSSRSDAISRAGELGLVDGVAPPALAPVARDVQSAVS
jgi:LuxR family transcriptional regulator, maltose regulon positive regulatory protein